MITADLQKFTGYMRRFLSGTLLSRISGLCRDVAMAYSFGDHPAIASFMVAFRFSQLFRRIFGEGALQSTFIPHYEELRLQSEEKASRFFKDLTKYLSLFLTGIIAITCTVLAILSHLSFIGDLGPILNLTAWMLPSLLFVCLYALNSAALQCHGSYFLAGFAPVMCNLTWIAGCFLIHNPANPSSMVIFSMCVVTGFVLQWLILIPKTWNSLTKNVSVSFLSKEEIKKISKAFFLATIGIGATQINSTLDALFAHYANVKGPIYLWYAIRIEQLPLALFGIGLVSAVTPTLSRFIKNGKKEEAYGIFCNTRRRLNLLMIFFTGGIFALGMLGLELLFQHGNFNGMATKETAFCLYGYGIGLLPAALVLLYSSIFYALGDFKSPMRFSMYSVLLNVALNSFFVMGLGWEEVSIAIATSISAFGNLFLLHRALAKNSFLETKASFADNIKGVFSAFVAVMSVYGLKKIIGTTHTLIGQILHLGILGIFFTLLFAGVCILLRHKEALNILRKQSAQKLGDSDAIS